MLVYQALQVNVGIMWHVFSKHLSMRFGLQTAQTAINSP